MTCTVTYGNRAWLMDPTVEGVAVFDAPVRVPVKEVWTSEDHDFRNGTCVQCGESE